MINVYDGDLKKSIGKIVSSPGVKIYNATSGAIQNIDANDVVLINILDLDNYKYLDNIKLSRYFLRKYRNISTYYVIVNKNFKSNSIYSLLDEEIETFIKKNNIRDLVIYASADVIREHLNLKESNKIIVANRRYDLGGVFDSSISVKLLEKFLKDINKTKIIYDRNKIIQKNREISDEYLINSMNRIIIIENFNGLKFPVFAILDAYSKIVFITKFSGEIIYILEDRDFCYPSSIKYTENKLFVLDLCNESIKYLNLDKQRFVTLLNDARLYELSDLEFTEGENFIFSKMAEKNGINFYKNNNFSSLGDRINLNYSVEWVDRISRIDNTFYYFDKKNEILYSLENNRNNVVVDVKIANKSNHPANISNFYVNSKNDIYFTDTLNHRIFRYFDGSFYEQSFGFDVNSPNDLVIYKNLFFILSDKYIQVFDMYNNNYSKITPYISANTKYVSDTINDISFMDIDENTVKTDEFDVFGHIGIDRNKILNPSFIMLFRNYDNELSLEKFSNYDNILAGDGVYTVTDEESIVYGKLYYDDSGESKVRTIIYKLIK
jgi:hypothetical protein